MPAGNVLSEFCAHRIFSAPLFSPTIPGTGTRILSVPSAASAGARYLPSPPFSATPLYPAALRQYFSLEDFPALSAPSAGALSAVFGPIPSAPGPILPPTYAYPAARGAAPALPVPATLNLDHLGRPLTWSGCLSGPHWDIWLDLSGLEFIKLVRSTGTLAPCMLHETYQDSYLLQSSTQ
jgi:hypothetical protein